MSNLEEVEPWSNDAMATDREYKVHQSLETEEMQEQFSQHPQWDDVSFFSRIMYLWLIPFYRNKVQSFALLANMFRLPKKFQIDDSVHRFEMNWEKEKSKADPQLWKATVRTFWCDWLWFALPHQINTVLSLLVSLVVGRLIDCTNDECDEWEGYVLAVALFIMLAVSNTAYNYNQVVGELIGAKIRNTFYIILYKHALKLKLGTSGHELMSVAAADLNEIDNFVTSKYTLFAPIGLIISTVLLYLIFGVAGLLGAAIFVLILCIMVPMLFHQRNIKLRIGYQIDERVMVLTSILEGIRTVKLYAWELAYQKIISKFRNDELRNHAKLAVWQAFYWAVLITLAGLILLVIFSSYIAFGNELTSSKAFTALSLVVITLNAFVGRPAIAFSDLFVVSATLTRIGSALSLQPCSAKGITMDANKGILLEQLSASWVSQEAPDKKPKVQEEVLQPLAQIQTPEQQQAAIVTKQQTPKANQVIPLTTEDAPDSNQVVPLTAQDIHSSESSDGDSSDEESIDVEAMRAARGVRTDVAEMRRTRTSVAMSNDTISFLNIEIEKGELAVIVGPTGSGKSSILSAILGEMSITKGSISLGGKIAYLAQEPWLRHASLKDNIIMNLPYDAKRYNEVIDVCCLSHDLEILTNGDETLIGYSGSTLSGGQMARISLARAVYADADIYLLDDPLSGVDAKVRFDLYNKCICNFLSNKTRILVTHQLAVVENAQKIICINNGMFVVQGNYANIRKHPDVTALLGQIAKEQKEKEFDQEAQIQDEQIKDEAKGKDQTAINDDEESIGDITFSMFRKYWGAGGTHWFVLILVFFAFVQFLYMVVPYWVSVWAAADDQEDFYYTWVFLVLGIALFLGGMLRSILLYWFLLNCNGSWHEKLLSSVIHAPVSFFNSNPAGRLINRFFSDQVVMDLALQIFQSELIQTLFTVIGNFVIIIILTPLSLAAMAPLLIFVYFLYRITIPCAMAAMRNEHIYKSPILNDYDNGLAGLPTIRAYGYESWLQDVMKLHIHDYSRCLFSRQTLRMPFQYYADLGATLFVTVNVLLIYSMRGSSSGDNDISLGIAVGFAPVLAWAMCELVNQNFLMTYFARVLQYCDIEPEPAMHTDKQFQIKEGKIEFREVCMRYRPDLDYSLKNLSFVVEPGTKVGIVGRTGAGKSSILQVLSRLVDAHAGQVLIDSQDTFQIGLHDLRKQISVIPQKPFILPDSIQQNLDPFGEFSSDQIWAALEAVSLRPFFEEQPDKLETNVVSTVALSNGQQQLVALARAILNNRKILFLDEATANLDPSTDEFIQEKIREHFSNCTVFSIAHRLDTIIDSDKILVMDSGYCKEFKSPAELLANPESLLCKMVDALGKADSEKLRKKVERGRNLESYS